MQNPQGILTACIYIISSDVCAFSEGAGVNLEGVLKPSGHTLELASAR